MMFLADVSTFLKHALLGKAYEIIGANILFEKKNVRVFVFAFKRLENYILMEQLGGRQINLLSIQSEARCW